MTAYDKDMRDPRRDEVIAGEYVLGALSAEDRRKVERRLAQDRRFAAMVSRWERNLATVEDGETRLPAVGRRAVAVPPPDAALAGPVAGGLWNSLPFWRALALALFAVLVAFAVTPRPVSQAPAEPEPASDSVRAD